MTTDDNTEDELPFSLLVAVRTIGDDGLRGSFEAGVKERAALAEAFELERLDLFQGVYELTPKRNRKFAMDATYKARLAQQCVVSLEPIESEVAETFAIEFLPEGEGGPQQQLDLTPDGVPREPYSDGQIDVGAALAQHLSLAIDPYPRKADAKLDWTSKEDGDDGVKPPGPFSALAKLGRDEAS